MPWSVPLTLHPIGVVHTPWKQPTGTPIQGAFRPDVEGEVVLTEELAPALHDLDGFSHAIVLYAFHRSEGYRTKVVPYLDDVERGLFATRAPRRPNPIGLTVVRILAVEGHRLRVAGVDMLDGTPVLDIKPYVPAMDRPDEVRIGWLERALAFGPCTTADDRFHEEDR